MDIYTLTQIVEKYFTPDEVRQLLRLRLNKDMASITQAGNFRTQIFEVALSAERENWLDQFIEVIKGERPHANIDGLEGKVVVSSEQENEKDIKTVITLLTGGYGQDGFIQKTEKRLTRIEKILEDDATSKTVSMPLGQSILYVSIGIILAMSGYAIWAMMFSG